MSEVGPVERIDVDGTPVAFTECGAPDGAPVLYCHGSPGSRIEAEVLAEAATDAGVRLVAPDRPGMGGSAFEPDRTIGDWARTADAVADAISIDEFGVLGFSGGGPYALAAAARLPDRVERLGLLAGAAPPTAPREGVDRQTSAASLLVDRTPRLSNLLFRGTAWIAARRSPAFATGFYTDRPVGPDGVDPAVAEVLQAAFTASVPGSGRGVVHDLRLVDGPWDVDPASVGVPVVARYGGRDGNVPVAQGEWLIDTLPDASLEVLPGADHLAVLTEAGPDLVERVAP